MPNKSDNKKKRIRFWIILILLILIAIKVIVNPHLEEKESFENYKFHRGIFLNRIDTVDDTSNCLCNSCVEKTQLSFGWLKLKDECKSGKCVCLKTKKRLVLFK